MKQEIWRMDNVTNELYGITQLRQFNLQIYAGEIMGLLPLNSNGVDALLELLQRNTPLHFGRVYCDETLVNSHVYCKQTPNPVAVIEKRSHLVEGLTVADNVFVLNRTNHSLIVRPNHFRQRLKELEEAVGVDILCGCLVKDLNFFERCIVEVMKAAVSNNKLVVISDISHFMTGTELRKLHQAIRYFSQKGTSFLYICNNWHETAEICDRVALMYNGTISKVIRNQEMQEGYVEELIRQIAGVTTEQLHSAGLEREVCFQVEGLSTSLFHDLSFHVHRGECLVIYSESQNFLDCIRKVITGDEPIYKGWISVEGKRTRGPLIREKKVGYLAENPAHSMLFPDLSNVENLTFGLMDQIQIRWNRKNIYKSLKIELGDEIGTAVFEKELSDLSVYDRYALAFYRLILQHPQVVFCEHPFFGNDVSLRSHVMNLVHQLLEHQIAVVVLVVGLYDTFPLSDRNLMYCNGEMIEWTGEKTEVT